MSKQLSHFICQQCGAMFPKWQGQCSQCGQWNTLVETAAPETQNPKNSLAAGKSQPIIKLSGIKLERQSRVSCRIEELDRVLGGGIVSGSLVLVSGDPGIGKSTLLTQLALNLVSGSSSILYVCGEESPQQIKLRINRMEKLDRRLQDRLLFLPETNLENILATIQKNSQAYTLIIIDSIQTLWSQNLTGSAGAIGQIKYCAQVLQTLAKKSAMPIFLIGHINKEGAIAGPKTLEHLVDTVLYLEGDQKHDFRILRASKNRFGPTDEVGIFTMTESGMEQVKDPSSVFLSGDRQKSAPGRAITISMQGIRPLAVEIQALTVPSQLAMPRRVASGIDYKKMQVLCAVVQKHLGLSLSQSDVFVNVAAGLKLTEPAADLAVCLAIASSYKNKPLIDRAVCLGEVGLLGEISRAALMEKRIKHCQKLGYQIIIGQKETSLQQTLKYLA